MICFDEVYENKYRNSCIDNIQDGIYIYNEYINKSSYISHIMFVKSNIRVCFKIFYNIGSIKFMGLDDYDYYNYTNIDTIDYIKIKKFLEIEFIKLVSKSIINDNKMNRYKSRRIELNRLIKFLDKYGPS